MGLIQQAIQQAQAREEQRRIEQEAGAGAEEKGLAAKKAKPDKAAGCVDEMEDLRFVAAIQQTEFEALLRRQREQHLILYNRERALRLEIQGELDTLKTQLKTQGEPTGTEESTSTEEGAQSESEGGKSQAERRRRRDERLAAAEKRMKTQKKCRPRKQSHQSTWTSAPTMRWTLG